MEINIETFNPTKAEIAELKIKAEAITETSPLREIVDMRKVLVKKRGDIERFGKSLRDEANKFNSLVLEREHELVNMIEPEEKRLKQIESYIKERARMEARKSALPVRHEALAKIGDGIEATDSELLEMDDAQFTEYRIARIDEKQEADRLRLEAEQRALEEEKARIAREQEVEEAKKRAVVEAEERAKREADERVRIAEQAKADAERREKEAQEEADRKLKAEQERQEREKKEAEDARIASEKKEVEDKKKLEKMKKYRAFRTEHGWNEETRADYKEENTGTTIELWKRVGIFEL